MRKINIIFILISISLLSLHAQKLDSVHLQDLIIKENRFQVPFSQVSRNIEVITRKQIDEMPARNIAELLSYVSGIDMRQRGIGGVQADVNIRGGTFDQTLILLDGFPLIDPQSGHHLMNLPIDSKDIERIEILKGAGARIYGPNAFAGVVNFVSRKLNTEGGARFSANYSEVATVAIKAGISVPSQNMPTRLSYSRQTSAGYRNNTDYSLENFFFQSQLKLSNQKIDLQAGHTNRKFGASGFYAGPASNKYAALFIDNFTDEYETVKTSFASASTSFKTEKLRITPRFYWRKNADDYYFVRNTPIFNSTTSDIFGGELQSSYESTLGTTGVGISLQKTKFHSLKLDTTNRTQTAVFFEHRFHLLKDKLDITPGIMYSNYSDFGGDLFPGIDIGYKVKDDLKLYATWGKTLRIPTFTDLYFNNASNANNPHLTPEKAQNYEAGIKYAKGLFRANASWFSRDGSNIIDRVKTDTTAGVKWFPTNLASLNVSGFDFGVDFMPTLLRGGDYWLEKIGFSMTYISKVAYKKPIEVKASRYALDQLKYQINLTVESKIVGHLSQSFHLRYFERLTLPKGFEEFYKGYLADWRLMWTKPNYRLVAQVNNLFNKKYVESNGITMPRRWFSVGIETQFGKY
jgi:vitamin B12 transporter